MPSSSSLNSLVVVTSIVIGEKSPLRVGTLISEYRVTPVRDFRRGALSRMPRPAGRAYLIALKQTLQIPNRTADLFRSIGQREAFTGYPVLAVQRVVPITTAPTDVLHLEDYAPRTLNASVATTASKSTSQSDDTSVQRTVGSSVSDTNNYEASISGMGLSFSAGEAHTATTESSRTEGQSASRGVQSSESAAMSIKDWASYAFVNDSRQAVNWVWGQEYPWNVIDFHSTSTDIVGGQHPIALPPYVQARLFDGTTLFPPSELAQFGVDFTATARWIHHLDAAQADADDTLTFDHRLTLWTGSHSAVDVSPEDATPPKQRLSVSLQSMAVDSSIERVQLNLSLLGLHPITKVGPDNGAIIGFSRSDLIAGGSGPAFRATSGANNLYVVATGFRPLGSFDAVLSAELSVGETATMTVQFKLADEDLDLSLVLKHWKTGESGCRLRFAVNEVDGEPGGAVFERHVDARDAGDGSNNLTIITLRKRDYTAAEFYDYLVIGLNTITITVLPDEAATACGYALRALAIG